MVVFNEVSVHLRDGKPRTALYGCAASRGFGGAKRLWRTRRSDLRRHQLGIDQGDARGAAGARDARVIALVLAVSLVEAFCILPGHLAGERPWSRSPLAEWQVKARTLLDDFVLSRVVRVIALAVRFPVAAVGTVLLGVLIAAGLVASGAAPYTSFPSSVGGDRLQAEVTMPAGTRFAVTAAAAERLAAAAGAVDRRWDGKVVDAVAVHVGGHRPLEHYTGIDEDPLGSHLATVEVKLKPAAERGVSIVDFERLWQRATGEIAGARQVSFKAGAALASSSVSHVLLHDDGDVLARAVADLARAYAGMDGVHEVDDSLALGKRRFDVRLSDAGVAAGLTAANVAGELRAAFFGAEVQRVQRGSEEIRVVVRYPGERRRSLGDLLDERVSLPGGGRAPLATVARITEVRDYAEQVRIDGRRAATVTAWFDVATTSAARVSAQVEAETLPTLLARHPGLEVREHGTTRELTAMAETLRWTFPLALLVVYGLLAAQLRSFAQPLLALASVPLALVGTVVGHLLLGYELTNMSLFGIVGVSGVVVNDTLLLLDRYNRIRREDAHLPAIAAISAAARHRARAIVLTTLTTVIGLAPMLYDKSEAIQFLVPMVISLGAGLVFASMGVLFLVPAVLILVEMARYSRVGLAVLPGKAAA